MAKWPNKEKNFDRIKLHIFLKLKRHPGRPSALQKKYRKNLQPSKENIQHSKHKKPSVAQLCHFEPKTGKNNRIEGTLSLNERKNKDRMEHRE
jgi:hypothetical protein